MKKKITTWSMMLALLISMLVTPFSVSAKKLYLDAGGSSKWDQGGAWFSAWVWGSKTGDAWYKATKGDVYYEIEVPDDATGMLWVRFSKVATKESWTQANGDKDGYWNKTGDLTIGADNLLTIKGWGTNLGTDYAWSTYTPPTPDPEPEPEPEQPEPEDPDTPVDPDPEDPDTPVDPEDPDTPVDPEPEDPDQPVEPEEPAANVITIKVAAPWDNCNLYAWYQEGEKPLSAWPGTAMTKGEDGFFTLDIEITGSVNLIANNGTAQTGDYKVGVTESTCFNVESLTLVVNEECAYEEPAKGEAYYGIRGLDGSWNVANDVKMSLSADGKEWTISGLEVDGNQEFKVVYVDETGATCGECWYGTGAVEANQDITNTGADNIKLAAGKYDIYFKLDTKTMWIAPTPAEDPDPEDPDQPVDPEDPDTPVIPEDPEQPVELEFALGGRLNGDNDNEILTFDEGYKFTKESEFVYTLNITFTGTIESSGKQVQKVKLIDAEGNVWARNNSKTIKPGDGTSTMTKGETASSTYLQSEAGVEYKITYTLVSDEANDLYKLSGQLTFEVVETPDPEDPDQPVEPEDPDQPVEPEQPEEPATITFTVQVPEGTIECYITGADLWNTGEFLQMEKAGDNLFTITTTTDVLKGTAWKYCSGPDWAYVEKDANGEEIANRTEAGNPDVVASWLAIYNPEPEEPTAVDEAEALNIYASEGTIYADAAISIYNLAGVDVTAQNGALYGIYVVKSENGNMLISVK